MKSCTGCGGPSSDGEVSENHGALRSTLSIGFARNSRWNSDSSVKIEAVDEVSLVLFLVVIMSLVDLLLV
jgi:hypothetical protein